MFTRLPALAACALMATTFALPAFAQSSSNMQQGTMSNTNMVGSTMANSSVMSNNMGNSIPMKHDKMKHDKMSPGRSTGTMSDMSNMSNAQ